MRGQIFGAATFLGKLFAGSRSGLLLAVVIGVGINSARADEPAFDYILTTERDSDAEGSSSIHPIDPAKCGTSFGWIEMVELSVEAEINSKLLAAFGRTIRVRKGGNVETFQTRPPIYHYAGVAGRPTLPGPPPVPAMITAEYMGCVVPTGTVLLSFQAVIEISSKHDPKRLVVTYQGPPRPNGEDWKVMKDLVKLYEVEADVGDATLSSIGINRAPDFSPERHKEFWISMRIHGQGASQ
ncbi:MAG: hypothetical protein AAGC79_06555 [Pseudomonadota bacterium]